MASLNPAPSDDSALAELHAQPVNGLPYGGDVTPEATFAYLAAHKGVLLDVRTPPEWQAGAPDMEQTPSDCLHISWKTYPDYALNPQFAEQVAAEQISKDTPLFFLCRSGGRSLDAALAMTAAGYTHCYNIAGGFEGAPNAQGQRGQTNGWKAAALPWKQR